MNLYTEQISANGTAIRLDVVSKEKIDHILTDMTFLNYRLGGVEHSASTSIKRPDFIWFKDEAETSIHYANKRLVLTGSWEEGELQRIIVSFLATRMFEDGMYIFHASAVNYKGKTIMFMGGESNSGKTMCQIEGCKRGGTIVSTETLVISENGDVINGSKSVFLRVRAKGTERIDKPNQDEGVSKFFDKQPEFNIFEGDTGIDLVVLPDIDGNYSTIAGEMQAYEKEYQTFHCLDNYIGDCILLTSGQPMPMFDTEDLRHKRADFIHKFASERTYLYIRADGPQPIVDEIDKYLES